MTRLPVINYLDVFPLLVAACPSFNSSTRASRANENDGEYLRVGEFVCHLVELLVDGNTDEFEAVFAIVEWALEQGDEEARSLIADGFLDDLTNPDLYEETAKQPNDFTPWVGPHARQHPTVQSLL
jgi:hypothetical protein